MLFTDPFFLFYFLPLALAWHTAVTGFRGGPYSAGAQFTIFAITLLFYGYYEPWWLIPFLICIVFDFLWATLLYREQDAFRRKVICFLSIAQGLSLLFLFKYWNYLRLVALRFIPSFGALLPELTHDGQPITLPPGISFYTFESLSFVIDVYRREVVPPRRPWEFFGFIGMFPRFVAGPIVRYRDMMGQFVQYRGPQLEAGLFVFILGLFMKTVFADQFAVLVPYAFDRPAAPGMLAAWIGVLSYTFQIYFDFGGYSLMAIGLGRCLGFQFPTNFNRPYYAASLQDFWRRWHITLSSWLRDYLYIPLGGGKQGTIATYRNLLITMALGGIWHGANVTFFIWGLWHGLFLCLERALPIPRRFLRLPTMFVVVIGWVWFRAKHLSEAGIVLKSMFAGTASFDAELWRANPMAVAGCVLGVIYFLVGERRIDPGSVERIPEISGRQRALALGLLAVSLLVIASAPTIPFLYFQF